MLLQEYSLFVDESTDVSVTKYLGVAINYISRRQQCLVSTFLTLTELNECNALGMLAALKSALDEYGLNLQGLIGISYEFFYVFSFNIF